MWIPLVRQVHRRIAIKEIVRLERKARILHRHAEYTLTTTCAMIRARFGRSWHPQEVHFEHACSPAASALETIFRAPVRFGRPANTLVIRAEDFDRPIAGSGDWFAPYVERQVRDMLGESSASRTIVDQVRSLIRRNLGHEPVTLESIAAALGVSTRSLQRHLAAEQTTLRELTREIRVAEAKTLLSDGHLRSGTVAHALGYADSTAFWRAFKSWSGMSPRTFSRASRKS